MRMATIALAAVMAALFVAPVWAQTSIPGNGVYDADMGTFTVVAPGPKGDKGDTGMTGARGPEGRIPKESDPQWSRFERVKRYAAMRQSWALHTRNKGEHAQMRGNIADAQFTANYAADAADVVHERINSMQMTAAIPAARERKKMDWMPLLWGVLIVAAGLTVLGMLLNRLIQRDGAGVATAEANARQTATTGHVAILGARPVVYGRTMGAPGTAGYFAEWRASAQPERPSPTEPVLYARRGDGVCGPGCGACAKVGDVIVTVGGESVRRTPREGSDDGDGSSHTGAPK